MTRHLTGSRIRTEPRFTFARSDEVSLQLGLPEPERVISATIIDCSAHGMTCQGPALPEGTAVCVTIAVHRLELHHRVTGVVRWCRLQGNAWSHGIEFDESLPQVFIAKLLEEGYLDRRQDPRAAIELPVRVRSELGQGESQEVMIVDFSAGGIRIEALAPLRLENRLLLESELSGDSQSKCIQVRPMWQQQREGVYVIGCCFLDASGVNVLRTWLQAELAPRQLPTRVSQQTWFWLSVAASLGAIAAGVMSMI